MSSERPSQVRVPMHHPTPEDLLNYATGRAEEWLDALVACHLTLCPECREEAAMLDALGGALLADLKIDDSAPRRPAGGSPPPSGEARTTTPVGGTTAADQGKPKLAQVPSDLASVVPRPLHAYFGEARPRFRWKMPGFHEVPLTLAGGGRRVQLVRFRPGFVVPEHGHAGLEWLMVLSGSLHDERTGEDFGKGDVSIRDAGDSHTQVIDNSQPCVAVFATLGPPVPKTLTGRLLAHIIGL